jgi:hypothetical protein
MWSRRGEPQGDRLSPSHSFWILEDVFQADIQHKNSITQLVARIDDWESKTRGARQDASMRTRVKVPPHDCFRPTSILFPRLLARTVPPASAKIQGHGESEKKVISPAGSRTRLFRALPTGMTGGCTIRYTTRELLDGSGFTLSTQTGPRQCFTVSPSAMSLPWLYQHRQFLPHSRDRK